MAKCPLDFNKQGGLIPVIVQDYKSRDILMQAYINEEAWIESLQTSRGVYYSRSREKIWRKGEISGHIQILKEVRVDCDRDCVLFMVEQVGGAACHTGHKSCFYRKWENDCLVETDKPLFDSRKVYKS